MDTTIEYRIPAAAELVANRIRTLSDALDHYDDRVSRELHVRYGVVYAAIAAGETDRFSIKGDLDDDAYDLCFALEDALSTAWQRR